MIMNQRVWTLTLRQNANGHFPFCALLSKDIAGQLRRVYPKLPHRFEDLMGMDIESFLTNFLSRRILHVGDRWINIELYPLGSWTLEDVFAIQEAAMKKKLRKKRAKNMTTVNNRNNKPPLHMIEDKQNESNLNINDEIHNQKKEELVEESAIGKNQEHTLQRISKALKSPELSPIPQPKLKQLFLTPGVSKNGQRPRALSEYDSSLEDDSLEYKSQNTFELNKTVLVPSQSSVIIASPPPEGSRCGSHDCRYLYNNTLSPVIEGWCSCVELMEEEFSPSPHSFHIQFPFQGNNSPQRWDNDEENKTMLKKPRMESLEDLGTPLPTPDWREGLVPQPLTPPSTPDFIVNPEDEAESYMLWLIQQ
eukprot:TRINITY_DN2014_c0_g3_i5.p1 TRINITY_DN2014_c0_g3~~TRINITY_DN2014_c0_g3_i5.p1  ORF type:complete len:364 (-),score=64.57 TRINITY_DN2014_c0_g3_i5:18-1109(-)